jgi:cell division protein YceG involved in septum cleavage
MKQITLAVALVVAATANALNLNNLVTTPATETNDNAVLDLLNKIELNDKTEDIIETADSAKITKPAEKTEVIIETADSSDSVKPGEDKLPEGLMRSKEAEDNSKEITATSAVAEP